MGNLTATAFTFVLRVWSDEPCWRADASEATLEVIQDVGLRPALCWIAHPNMVKLLPPGRRVGYGQTYV